MHVVDPAEGEPAPQGLERRRALDESNRHREPDERQPEDGREREPWEEQRRDDPDGHADEERDEPRVSRPPHAGGEGRRVGVAEREHRSGRGEHDRGLRPRLPDRDEIRARDDQAEREGVQERRAVEADSLGDELSDGPLLRRKRRRERARLRDPSPRHARER
jgi:hypothetical protein